MKYLVAACAMLIGGCSPGEDSAKVSRDQAAAARMQMGAGTRQEARQVDSLYPWMNAGKSPAYPARQLNVQ